MKMNWKHPMSIVTGVFAFVVSSVAGMETLGYDVTGYFPATRIEVASNTIRLDGRDLWDARKEWHDIKRDMDDMRRKKEPIPEYLKKRLFELNDKIKALEG